MKRLLLLVAVFSALFGCTTKVLCKSFTQRGLRVPSLQQAHSWWARMAGLNRRFPPFSILGPRSFRRHSRGLCAESIQVLGQSMQTDDFISNVTGGYYHAIGSYTHATNYDAGPNGKVLVHADIYVFRPHQSRQKFLFREHRLDRRGRLWAWRIGSFGPMGRYTPIQATNPVPRISFQRPSDARCLAFALDRRRFQRENELVLR